jgi:formamidopyrimidine-DNA glycosylase
VPELPEVEVTRLSLSPFLQGQTITRVWQGKALRFPLGCAPERLLGERISQLTRRGKYLLAHTQNGMLILHLGMSGSLRWHAGGTAPVRSPWVRFEISTASGTLQLDDPRRFGAVMWHETHERGAVALHPQLAKLGPEPLEPGFTGAGLYAHSRGRKLAIKLWLLAGQAVVGVGNIYASEVLFRARIHPALAAGRLSKPRADMLAQHIREVLAQAISQGGSTLRDFSNAHGDEGLFQASAQVYAREGKPCVQCGAPIKRITQGQRSTYFCAACQKR